MRYSFCTFHFSSVIALSMLDVWRSIKSEKVIIYQNSLSGKKAKNCKMSQLEQEMSKPNLYHKVEINLLFDVQNNYLLSIADTVYAKRIHQNQAYYFFVSLAKLIGYGKILATNQILNFIIPTPSLLQNQILLGLYWLWNACHIGEINILGLRDVS
jgi:hypothetical protein